MGSLQPRTGNNLLGILREWCRRHPYWALALLTFATLAPFLAKPFNLDDPLFIWGAQQIQSHPADPYGFEVNWFGFSEPMSEAMLNPPLMSYYLALAAVVLGWNEIGMHLACVLFAVGAVLGTYRLAKSCCQWPVIAGLAVLLTPGFLVSSTTVMCDVSMLAFWVWAIVFWTQGLKANNAARLSLAGILVGAATLTKFNGVCLLPLLLAYSWIETRKVGQWILFLLIPLAMLCTHEWITFHLYGKSHFFAANQFAQTHQFFHGVSKLAKAFNAITFIGGCFAIALFCSPYLWSRRALCLILGSGALLFALALAAGLMAKHYFGRGGMTRFSAEIQILLWSIGGVSVLALALVDVWRKRDSASWLLALWVFGIFTYAAFVYFMVNARALLPIAPAVAILIARRLEQTLTVLPAGISVAFLASAVLSLLAAQADFQQANTARRMAREVCAKYTSAQGRVWFQGHWGFQYYMQLAGAWPADLEHPAMGPGDYLVMPDLNSNGNELPINPKTTSLDHEFSTPAFPGFATLNISVGAGFYSSFWGPLPFAFGRISPQKVSVYYLRDPAKSP